jgi:type I restriction enzyme S subunit
MYAEKDGQSYIPFMHALFLRPRGKFLLELASPGGAGRNKTLGQEEFGKLIVTVPERREQVKIAGFLAALDSKIEQLERKRLLLGAYRKGCVADIFAQNLRFGAEKSGEWRECVFGSVYEFKPTNSLSREALNYDTGSVRNIHYGDIHTKFSPMFYLNREFVPFINDDIDIRSIPEDRYCRAGDLVIADASEDYADIGKTVEIMDLEGAKVLAGLHTLLARRLGNDLVPGFGAVVMGSEAVRMQMKLLAQGTKVLGISPGRIEKIKLPIPPKAEQEAIVAFVRAMDAKVASLTKMIDATRALRRGLSQELFV